MGLALDITGAMTVTLVAFIVVYMGGAVAEPTADIAQDTADLSIYGGQEYIDDSQELIFKWLPVTAIGGSWALVFVRHYRRQRLASRQFR